MLLLYDNVCKQVFFLHFANCWLLLQAIAIAANVVVVVAADNNAVNVDLVTIIR